MRNFGRASVLLTAVVALCSGQTAAPLKTLLQEPLPDMTDAKWSLYSMRLAPGAAAPQHSHAGTLVAYLLEGDIENQLDPDPPQVYHAGAFFREHPKQNHRVFRNLSDTASAQLLIFQNTATLPATIKPLLQESAPVLTDQELSVIDIDLSPGAAMRTAHQHPGPVFVYIRKGEVENQVDPDELTVYHAGEAFYEAPMHVHRALRNRLTTEPAELLIFQIAPKGQSSSIPAGK